MVATLPLDIWWLVCGELTARRDFDALYNFSLTSRTMANFALPNLYRYGIHTLKLCHFTTLPPKAAAALARRLGVRGILPS